MQAYTIIHCHGDSIGHLLYHYMVGNTFGLHLFCFVPSLFGISGQMGQPEKVLHVSFVGKECFDVTEAVQFVKASASYGSLEREINAP